MNDDELDAALAAANPHDERTLARAVPPGVGEAMIREITMTERGSFWQRLVDPIGSQRRTWGRAGFVGVLAVVALAVLAVNLVPVGGGGDELLDPAGDALVEECRASGVTLGEARTAYANTCSQPRLDCDPIDGQWICSNLQIGDASPNSNDRPNGDDPTTTTTAPPTSTTMPPTTSSPTTAPPTTTGVSDDACVAYGNNLPDAQATYARECDEPRVDCDPVDAAESRWMCSSERIGDDQPNPNPTTTVPGPGTTTPRPPTTISQPNGGACIVLEAESLGLVGDWKRRTDARASGGAYITWEGLSAEQNNGSPDDVLTTSIAVSQPGTYRFVWAMRQPSDVASDRANDSWVNFPDAARFGPATGGSYGGPVKVFGNGTGSFAWAARADQNHIKSDVAIEFTRAGTYTMEIAGRSHGHQIDQIVVYRDSVSRTDAINGRCGDANPDPNPDPNPTGMLGRFDLAKDILLCNYDSKPDEDDLHAVAGLGTMLADPRLAGINYHCTAGAYGRQGGTFLDEPALFDLAFGDNWASAHDDRDNAVVIAANEAIAALDAGGDVWVTEAGQSDVTARIVSRIKAQRPGVDTNQRVHVVQHSNWNENQTTPSDLTYVRNNTQYNKISDGNAANNGTPQLKTNSSQYWSQAKGDAQVGALWSEADAAARRGFAVDWNNESIVGGGMDFSDTVEPMYVFGFENRGGNVGGFFDEFL